MSSFAFLPQLGVEVVSQILCCVRIYLSRNQNNDYRPETFRK